MKTEHKKKCSFGEHEERTMLGPLHLFQQHLAFIFNQGHQLVARSSLLNFNYSTFAMVCVCLYVYICMHTPMYTYICIQPKKTFCFYQYNHFVSLN